MVLRCTVLLRLVCCTAAADRCGLRLPVWCVQEEIYSSSYAAAAYLESIQFPKDKKVYVVGEVGIQVRPPVPQATVVCCGAG